MRKVWSIILLCLIVLSFVSMVMMFVFSCVLTHDFSNSEFDPSNDTLPGASALAEAFVAVAPFAIWSGCILLESFISLVGFFCSLINIKISPTLLTKRISKAFLCFFSAILILLFLIIGLVVYIIVSAFF